MLHLFYFFFHSLLKKSFFWTKILKITQGFHASCLNAHHKAILHQQVWHIFPPDTRTNLPCKRLESFFFIIKFKKLGCSQSKTQHWSTWIQKMPVYSFLQNALFSFKTPLSKKQIHAFLGTFTLSCVAALAFPTGKLTEQFIIVSPSMFAMTC